MPNALYKRWYTMNKKTGIEFEAGMEKLQQIIDKLENGNVSLNESIKLYEEGMQLSELCFNELNKAKQKIEIIRNNYFEDTDIDAEIVENN